MGFRFLGPNSSPHPDFFVSILPCRILFMPFSKKIVRQFRLWACGSVPIYVKQSETGGRQHPWASIAIPLLVRHYTVLVFIQTLYSTHGAQPRPGVCTARRQSTPYVHGTGRPGISCKPMQQHIQSPGACVIWRARIDKCMASGAPADIQTYSAIRLLRYSHAISRRHVGPLINKPPFASSDLALPM